MATKAQHEKEKKAAHDKAAARKKAQSAEAAFMAKAKSEAKEISQRPASELPVSNHDKNVAMSEAAMQEKHGAAFDALEANPRILAPDSDSEVEQLRAEVKRLGEQVAWYQRKAAGTA